MKSVKSKKLVCLGIPKMGGDNFTLFKTYDIIEEDDSGWIFRGDKRTTFQLKHKSSFVTDMKYRKMKLEKLNEKKV